MVKGCTVSTSTEHKQQWEERAQADLLQYQKFWLPRSSAQCLHGKLMSIVRQLLKVSTILRNWALHERLQTYGKAKGTVQIIKELREPGLSSKQLEYFLIPHPHQAVHG